MKYMFLLCDTDPASGPDVVNTVPGIREWIRDTEASGIKRRGIRLRPASDAVTVRVRAGDVLVSDGPYADTKEQVGGFEIIECDDLDQAIDRAAAHPSAAGYVEIRAFPQED